MISVFKRSGFLKLATRVATGVATGAAVGVVLVLFASTAAHALEPNEYRQIAGLDSRRLVWFLAQMHLYFAAFVLGVPLFAVIIEIVGWKSGDVKYDRLSYEFTSLLSIAYATTAAFGGRPNGPWPDMFLPSGSTSWCCSRCSWLAGRGHSWPWVCGAP